MKKGDNWVQPDITTFLFARRKPLPWSCYGGASKSPLRGRGRGSWRELKHVCSGIRFDLWMLARKSQKTQLCQGPDIFTFPNKHLNRWFTTGSQHQNHLGKAFSLFVLASSRRLWKTDFLGLICIFLTHLSNGILCDSSNHCWLRIHHWKYSNHRHKANSFSLTFAKELIIFQQYLRDREYLVP